MLGLVEIDIVVELVVVVVDVIIVVALVILGIQLAVLVIVGPANSSRMADARYQVAGLSALTRLFSYISTARRYPQ